MAPSMPMPLVIGTVICKLLKSVAVKLERMASGSTGAGVAVDAGDSAVGSSLVGGAVVAVGVGSVRLQAANASMVVSKIDTIHVFRISRSFLGVAVSPKRADAMNGTTDRLNGADA